MLAVCDDPSIAYCVQVSLVVWHLVMICKGEDHFLQFQTLARSRVLGSLSVLTKSCMQLILQVSLPSVIQ